MAEYTGDFSPPAGRFAIVVGRFNALVTESLLAGMPRYPRSPRRGGRFDRRRVGARLVRDSLGRDQDGRELALCRRHLPRVRHSR